MFIVLVDYKRPLEDVEKVLPAHVAYLKEQYANGNFVASGRQVPRTGGIIMSKMTVKEALSAVLAKDPFNIKSIADYKIIEFSPTMTAAGFEILK